MCKLINKKNIHFLLSFIFSLIFCFPFGVIFANSNVLFDANSIGDLLSSWQSSVSAYKMSSYESSRAMPTDIFGSNLHKYQQKKIYVNFNSLRSAQSFFDAQYPQCKLSLEELSSILFFTNVDFADELRKNIPVDKLPKLSAYQDVCKKLTSCIEGAIDYNLNKDCGYLVNQFYSLGLEAYRNDLLVQESNLKKDIYWNGDIEDSAYDLFYDIDKIAKSLFEDVKSAPKILFYRLPQFNKSNKAGGKTSSQSNQNPAYGKKSNGKQIGGGGVNAFFDPVVGDSSSTSSLTEDPVVNDFIKSKNPLLTTSVGGDVVFVNYCLVGSKKIHESMPGVLGADSSLISEKQIDSYVDSILEESNTIKKIISPELPGSSSNSDIPVSSENKIVDDLKSQLESCVSKCGGLAFDERAVCKIQCLCSEYVSPTLPKSTTFYLLEEGALKARICSIPSKIVFADTSSKTLFSIEEFLKEIKFVVDGLYDSGELTTKTRTKEFLDTTQSKYNFWKNISFIVNFGTKDSTKEPNEKQEKKAEQEFYKKIKNANSFPDERNRYVLLGNYEKIKNQKSVDKPLTSKPIYEPSTLSPQTILLLNRGAFLNQIVSSFLDQNIDLLYKMNDFFRDLDYTLQSLAQKK